jgi:hypothetical protein
MYDRRKTDKLNTSGLSATFLIIKGIPHNLKEDLLGTFLIVKGIPHNLKGVSPYLRHLLTRILTALLILAVLLTSAALLPAHAHAQPVMTDAKICETLGILKGTGRGVTDEYLRSTPQRYQAARLFLRLQGKEQEAVRYTGSTNFSDVRAMPDWQFARENRSIIAYLYAHPELGFIGYTDGTYRPFNKISAMEYYKVLLTALGYEQDVDFRYGEDMLKFAEEKGLTAVARVTNFTISDLATATREALTAKTKGTNKTLIESLVEKGVIDKNVALSTGIYGEPVLEVESVTAQTPAEISLRFNHELDGDTVKPDYFTVDGKKAATVTLGEDGRTVNLVPAKDSIGGNGVKYVIEVITDVRAKNGAVLKEAYKTDLRVFDISLPRVTDVVLTGPQTIELTFSEPIKTKGEVKINNGIYGCRVEDITAVTNKVKVHIFYTRLPENDYSIDIGGFMDYAGLAMDPYRHTLRYVKDTTSITAEILEVGQTEVKVRFNKAVKLEPGEEKSYFYHTFPKWTPDSVLTLDNENYTIKFIDHPIQEGTTKLVVKASGANNVMIQDLWGNKLQTDIILNITASSDNTPPAVAGDIAVKSQNSMEVSFTEDVIGADKKENYTVEDSSGNKIDISTIVYDNVNHKATIYFKSNLAGNYTIIIRNITDSSVNENVIKETVLSLNVDDMTPPDHTKVEVSAIDRTGIGSKDVLFVRYPEKMAVTGDYSVLDAGNYLLDGSSLPSGTVLELFDSEGKVVVITLPDASRTLSGKKLTIGKVADLAGNTVRVLSFSVDIKQEAPPIVTEVRQTASDRMEVTINKALQSVLPDAFIFNVSGTEYTAGGVVRHYPENSSTIVEISLSTSLINALKGKNANYGSDTGLVATGIAGVSMKIAGRYIVSEAGISATDVSDLAAGDPANGIAPVQVKDGWRPSLKGISVENDVFVDTYEFNISNDDDEYDSIIVLDFTESIPGDTNNLDLHYAHDLVIRDTSGKALIPSTQYVTYVNAGDLVVVISDVRVPLGPDEKKYTIASVEEIKYIMDSAGNAINTFAAREIK